VERLHCTRDRADLHTYVVGPIVIRHGPHAPAGLGDSSDIDEISTLIPAQGIARLLSERKPVQIPVVIVVKEGRGTASLTSTMKPFPCPADTFSR